MLDRCALFQGLSVQETREALALLSGQEKSYVRGEVVKGALSPLRAFGLVLSGQLHVTMQDIDGREMLFTPVEPGSTFGEALCYLRESAPLIITAQTDSRVLWLRCDALRGAAQSPLQFQLQARFTAMLARRTLRMNDRIQILSRGSLREKLNAFFAECARDAGGPVFDLPFDRAGMAAYLGADRSALSRELSHMAREGVVRYRKNHFELIPAFD